MEPLLKKLRIELSDPVTIVQAPDDVRHWGPYQFPGLQRLPDGRIQISFQVCAASATAVGLPPPPVAAPPSSYECPLSWRRRYGNRPNRVPVRVQHKNELSFGCVSGGGGRLCFVVRSNLCQERDFSKDTRGSVNYTQAPLSLAMDDLRRLGELDLKLNRAEAGSGRERSKAR